MKVGSQVEVLVDLAVEIWRREIADDCPKARLEHGEDAPTFCVHSQNRERLLVKGYAACCFWACPKIKF